MNRSGFLAFLGAMLTLGASPIALAQNSGGVPAPLLAKFKRGLNITRWFCYLQNPNDTKHFADYLVDEDFATFKKLHVTWIRLCVSPEAIYQDGHPNSQNLPYLDQAVDKLERAGLTVLIDLHDNGQMKLDQPGHNNEGFVSFWRDMARHYAGKQETSTVFELLNEPQFNADPSIWHALQQTAVSAVREVDPKRTIMVSGTSWSGIEALAKLPKLPESNLLYTFHCYDPFLFTHQGATWVGDPPQGLKSMPFPSSPENVQEALAASPAKDAEAIKSYGGQHFDAAYLKARVQKGAEYGIVNHVPVVLGEFGAYPPVSPVESRSRWFAAMSVAIEDLHIPNAIWGYDDGLGLGRQLGADGKLKLDPITLRWLYGVSPQ
jgi:endoglucanase